MMLLRNKKGLKQMSFRQLKSNNQVRLKRRYLENPTKFCKRKFTDCPAIITSSAYSSKKIIFRSYLILHIKLTYQL